MSDLWITVIAAIIMIIGMCGTLLPLLPGMILMWVTGLGYGYFVGFGSVGTVVMVILTILLLVSFAAGVLIPKKAADQAGVSWITQLGGVAGAIIGFFVIPVVGVVVGGLAGVLLIEYLDHDDLPAAWASTKQVALGVGIAALAQFALGIVAMFAWSGWALTVVF